MFSTVFQGKVMYEIGIEIVGQSALKLTGFLKELMLRRNISCQSLYTVRTIKEVNSIYATIIEFACKYHLMAMPQLTVLPI
jgi:hypothetical protein